MRHADNPYLMEIYKMISTKVQAMRSQLTFSQEYVSKSVTEHQQVLQALRDGQVEQACIMVAQHIENGFTARTRRLLAEG